MKVYYVEAEVLTTNGYAEWWNHVSRGPLPSRRSAEIVAFHWTSRETVRNIRVVEVDV